MSARTRKDWILWGALGCALVSTAHAEYTLATAAHFQKYVALAVPGALDLYVIRALQQRRDVLVAVLAMVSANVASHLIAGGVLDVTWHVIAAVGAVAPLIVWRVYSLKYTRTRQELLWGLDAGAGPEDAGAGPEDAGAGPEDAGAVRAPALGCTCSWWRRVLAWLGWSRWCECTPSAPAPDERCAEHTAPESAPAPGSALALGSALGSALGDAVKSALGSAPDHVPADWAVPYLHPVPDLPDECTLDAVHSVTEPLLPGDLEFLAGAQEYVDKTPRPSVRGLKRALNVGQDRAERLLAHLGVKL